MYIKKQTLTNFLTYLKENEHSTNTILKYERDVKKFIRFLCNRQITKCEVLAFKGELMKTYKAASVNSMLAAVNVFLKFLGQHDCTVKRIKTQPKSFCNEKHKLTVEDYKKLLKAAKRSGDYQLLMILQTICATGIRVSELSYFNVESLGHNVLEVRNKGKSRTILIPRKLIRELKRYCKKFKIHTGFIFQNKNKKPVDRKTIWLRMKNLCKITKVDSEKVFPHNLRHLFAKTFYKVKNNLVELSCIFGHSSIETTRRYLMPNVNSCLSTLESMSLVIESLT